MRRFALNLSAIWQPCVRVAAMVVSEINDRLSPKKAPPSTAARYSGTSAPELSASSTTRGVRATTVPTDVPIDMLMRQAAIKMAGSTKPAGNTCMVRRTVASTAPMPLASEAKAPARIKIHTIYNMFSRPAASENTFTRSPSGFPLYIIILHTDAAASATVMGTA